MNEKIKCPKCFCEIDVTTILANQVEAKLKEEFNNRWLEHKQKLDKEKEMIDAQFLELQKQKATQAEQVAGQVGEMLQRERAKLSDEIKTKIESEKATQLTMMQEELNAKVEQVKELNKVKAEIEQVKREKEVLKDELEMAAQKKLNEQIALERARIQKLEQEKNELKMAELQKQLQDQKALTDEMKRKQEQGSMQLQGEVQELAIEDWLRVNFPLDIVDEISKGARGADCIQVVNTREHQNCGSIYYESKRTKEFQPSWIEKFKADMRAKNASFGVLVTEVKPKDMERFGQREGIWVCNFEEFKALCFVIRESVVLLHQAGVSQENKGDKMHLLYDFLTGNEFRSQIEAIVEGFSQMQEDLATERRAMEKQWKMREKQLQKVVINTTHMYASVKGIAGSSIKEISLLELPGNKEEQKLLEMEAPQDTE